MLNFSAFKQHQTIIFTVVTNINFPFHFRSELKLLILCVHTKILGNFLCTLRNLCFLSLKNFGRLGISLLRYETGFEPQRRYSSEFQMSNGQKNTYCYYEIN